MRDAVERLKAEGKWPPHLHPKDWECQRTAQGVVYVPRTKGAQTESDDDSDKTVLRGGPPHPWEVDDWESAREDWWDRHKKSEALTQEEIVARLSDLREIFTELTRKPLGFYEHMPEPDPSDHDGMAIYNLRRALAEAHGRGLLGWLKVHIDFRDSSFSVESSTFQLLDRVPLYRLTWDGDVPHKQYPGDYLWGPLGANYRDKVSQAVADFADLIDFHPIGDRDALLRIGQRALGRLADESERLPELEPWDMLRVFLGYTEELANSPEELELLSPELRELAEEALWWRLYHFEPEAQDEHGRKAPYMSTGWQIHNTRSVRACAVCGRRWIRRFRAWGNTYKANGWGRVYCSDACKQQHYRRRKENGRRSNQPT